MSEPIASHIDRHKIMEATEQLPFPQVEALWLVDVCGIDYAIEQPGPDAAWITSQVIGQATLSGPRFL